MKEFQYSIRKDSHSLLQQIVDLTELRKYNEPDGTISFGKIVFKGELDFYDYNVGAFFLKAYILKQKEGYCVRLWVETWDDGDMGAWGKQESLEEATERLTNLSKIMEPLVCFPKREELNEELIKIGLYLDYE